MRLGAQNRISPRFKLEFQLAIGLESTLTLIDVKNSMLLQNHNTSGSNKLPSPALALLFSAEREIAKHGYSGAQLKRAAKHIGVNPAQYNYYFSSQKRRAIEAVAEQIFRLRLTRIDEIRCKMIKEIDVATGVSTFTRSGEPEEIKYDFANIAHYTNEDILKLLVLPTLRFVVEQHEQGEGCFFGRFSLMMFLEDPSVYFLTLDKLNLPGHQYLKKLSPQIIGAEKAAKLKTKRFQERLARMHCTTLSTFETDLENAETYALEVSLGDMATSLMNCIGSYVAPIMGDTVEISDHDRKMLYRAGLI